MVYRKILLRNIDPQACSTKENKAIQKQMEILMKNEDLLTNTLTDKPKKWFLDYVNTWGVVNGESNLDSFIMGFCLGANFAYEAFISTEKPFQDLLKSNVLPKNHLIFNIRRKKCNEQQNTRCFFVISHFSLQILKSHNHKRKPPLVQ